MGRGWRWMGGDARARELTLLPLSSDEGIKYNRKGLPQLPGDAGTACILQGPDSSSDDLPPPNLTAPGTATWTQSLLSSASPRPSICYHSVLSAWRRAGSILRISGMHRCQQLDELILQLFSFNGWENQGDKVTHSGSSQPESGWASRCTHTATAHNHQAPRQRLSDGLTGNH